MKGLFRFGMTATIVWVSVSAFADITSLRTSATGKATFELAGRKNNVDRIEVNLGKDRRFEVVISGGNQRYQFTGEWIPLGSKRAVLSIKSGSLASTSGEGMVTVDDQNKLDTVMVRGKSKSGEFYANFDINSKNSGDDDRGGNREISSTVQGSGKIQVGSASSPLKQFGANLQSNGVIEMFFQTDRGTEIKLRGRWFERRGQAYDILISDIDNSSKVEARGVLTMMGRNTVAGIELAGTQGRERFSVDFEAGRNPNSSRPTPSTWKFDSERKGNGTLKARGDEFDFGKARVKLNSNNTFEISFKTSKEYTYSGTWKHDGDTAKLTVTRGGLGTGELRVKGNQWVRFDLDVLDNGARFAIRFDAK